MVRRRKLLGMSGIANVAGEPIHVQVIGESDAGRLVVADGDVHHVVTREAFVADIAIASEPVSDAVRTAATTLAQAIERAKAMVGVDHLLRQEDYQVLVDELDDTDRYPFASALLENGVQVRTSRRADVDVVTHPDDSGAGEPAGAGIDGPDQPGFVPWTPADSTPSNDEAHTENDFPGVRQIEGQAEGTLRSGEARCNACQHRDYANNFDETDTGLQCPECSSTNVSRSIDQRDQGRYDYSTMEHECVCGHRLGDHNAEPPRECFIGQMGDGGPMCDCEKFRKKRKRAQTEWTKCPKCGAPNASATKCAFCGEVFGERDAEMGWSGSELVNERWAQVDESLIQSVGSALAAGASVEEIRDSLLKRGMDEADIFLAVQAAQILAKGAQSSMSDLLSHPRKPPESDLSEEIHDTVEPAAEKVAQDKTVEKDSDLTSPSGRDRGLNPSVHEQIGDAYRSDNQWEDPDLHLGTRAGGLFGHGYAREFYRVRALGPDEPAVRPPYDSSPSFDGGEGMYDDVDREEVNVQVHASMQDIIRKLVQKEDAVAKPIENPIVRKMADAFRLSTDVSLESRRRIASRIAQSGGFGDSPIDARLWPDGYKPIRGEDYGLAQEEARIIDYFVAKLRDPGPPDLSPPPPWQPPIRERLVLSFVGATDMSEIDTVTEKYRGFKVPLYAWALKNAILRDGYTAVDWIQEFEGGSARKIASEYLPRHTNISVDIGDSRTVQVGGMLFLRDSKGRSVVAVLDLDNAFEPPTIKVYARRGQQRAANDFFKSIDTRAYTDNFYRGKLLTIEGQKCGGVLTFLPMERVAWQDVILPDHIVAEIRDNTVEILRHKAMLGPRIGLKRSLLLLGHPGTGKSIAAKATATEALRMHEADCTVIWVTGQSIKWSDHIKDLYEAAKELAPTMLIYEDIDQIGGDRWKGSGQRNELLAELLTSMDGAESNDGIITLASSNDVKLDLLDVALSDRPGRFDRKVSFPLPSPEHRETMLARFLLGMGADLGRDVTEQRWASVVTGTSGMTGAYLKELAKTAVIRAVQRQPSDRIASQVILIAAQDLDEALRVTRQNLEYRQRTAQVSTVPSVAPSGSGASSAGQQTGDVSAAGMGVAGDAFETKAEGEGVEDSAGDADYDGEKEPNEFGVMTSLSMRQVLAQQVENRQSDPNVQTDVDEQMGDRAIQRAPEDEPVRYSMRNLT